MRASEKKTWYALRAENMQFVRIIQRKVEKLSIHKRPETPRLSPISLTSSPKAVVQEKKICRRETQMSVGFAAEAAATNPLGCLYI